jgi:Ca-activated chloride channel family protein
MHLAQPAWLLLLILLPLLGAGSVLVARLRRKQWSVFVAPRLRGVLLRTSSPLPRWLALTFLMAACAALIGAMARPQGDAGTKTEKTIGRNLLIALDLSRSMRVKDVKPDRLAQAKIVIYELMEAMPNERIGLIGFAGSTHLFAPLTVDHAAVRESVEQADESWVAMGGSNLTSAIQLAIKTLKETGQKNNALIILSDGEKHDKSLGPITAEAKRAGVYIFAIGVGTEDGGFVPNPDFPNGNMVGPDGKVVLSRLQPEVMRKLAIDTNGRFAVAGSGTDIAAMVKLAAKDLDAFELKGRERRIAIEFYQWLVLPAILFLIVSVVAGTRWRGVKAATAVLAGCLALQPAPARAGEAAAAAEALAKGRFGQAREAFDKLAASSKLPERAARFRLGEATAAYRDRDFAGARAAYSRALLAADPAVSASAHFGLANSLFQLGWKSLAKETYPSAADQVPDLPRFDALVKSRLSELLKDQPKEDAETAGLAELETLIVNWADAAKHYQSALATDPDNPDLRHNRDTTVTYLKRLMELLDEEREQTEESIPEPQPTPSPGNPGDEEGDAKDPKPGDKPDGEEPKDGAGDQDPPKDPKDDGKNGDKPKDPPGDKPDGSTDKEKRPDDGDQPDDEEPAKPPKETPEQAARRILGENADLEKGPLQPGRHELRNPEKDW